MAQREERRQAPRHAARRPLQLRSLDDVDAYAYTAELIDVSERGLYFHMQGGMNLAGAIEVLFTMPGEVTGGLPMRVRCTARVLRVEPQPSEENVVGVAAQIERFESAVAEL